MPFPNTAFLYERLTLKDCRIPYLCLLLWLSSWLSNPLLPGRLLEMPPPPRGFPAPHSQHQTCSLWHTLRTCPSSSETFASSNHDFAFLSYSVALISASLRCLAQCLAQRNQKIRIDFLNCDLNSRTWSFKIMRERFPTYRSLLIYKENGLLYCCSYPE